MRRIGARRRCVGLGLRRRVAAGLRRIRRGPLLRAAAELRACARHARRARARARACARARDRHGARAHAHRWTTTAAGLEINWKLLWYHSQPVTVEWWGGFTSHWESTKGTYYCDCDFHNKSYVRLNNAMIQYLGREFVNYLTSWLISNQQILLFILYFGWITQMYLLMLINFPIQFLGTSKVYVLMAVCSKSNAISRRHLFMNTYLFLLLNL